MSKSENKKSAPPKTHVASKTGNPTGQIEPTPRPWIIDTASHFVTQGHFPIYGNDGIRVCEPHVTYDGSSRREKYPDGIITSKDKARANAELICRAVNNHEELLAACKTILADLETGYIAQDSVAAERNRDKREQVIRAAIANAEKA